MSIKLLKLLEIEVYWQELRKKRQNNLKLTIERYMNSYQLRRKTMKRKVEIMTVLANFGVLGQPQLLLLFS
jgi:hypothetical protein